MPTWFITGCSTGLGRALAGAALAGAVLDAGHAAAITARDPASLEYLVDAHPETALTLALDVTDTDQVAAAVDQALERFGGIDVAVNNAGYGYRAAVEEGEPADVEHLFATNVFGPVAVMKAVLFRDGRGPGDRPPSTLRSVFGGPAWQAVGDGQFYLHLFAPEQPDLDWTNQEVHEDALATLRFWADRGVDGFRVDVAHSLVKDVDALLAGDVEIFEAAPRTDGSHPVWDRDELQVVYARWRQVLDSYDPPRAAVAETQVHPDRRSRYADPGSLGQAFNVDFHAARFDAREMRATIASGAAQAAAGASCA